MMISSGSREGTKAMLSFSMDLLPASPETTDEGAVLPEAAAEAPPDVLDELQPASKPAHIAPARSRETDFFMLGPPVFFLFVADIL